MLSLQFLCVAFTEEALAGSKCLANGFSGVIL